MSGCDTVTPSMKRAHSDLLVVSYPEMAPEDLAWIEAIRAEHHPRQAAIAAHVTLVFPVASVDPPTMIAEVQRQAAGSLPIPFTLRCAVPFRDLTSEATDVFLVPDEGFGPSCGSTTSSMPGCSRPRCDSIFRSCPT
jgi:hypothetical protein